jgi:hypothetical protein
MQHSCVEQVCMLHAACAKGAHLWAEQRLQLIQVWLLAGKSIQHTAEFS